MMQRVYILLAGWFLMLPVWAVGSMPLQGGVAPLPRQLLAENEASRFEAMPNAPAMLFPPGGGVWNERPVLPQNAEKKAAAPEHKKMGTPAAAPLPANELDASSFVLSDDLDLESLTRAVENQLAAWENADLAQLLRLDALTLPRQLIRESLEEFLQILRGNPSPEEFNRMIKERFDIIPAGVAPGYDVLFTGYYTPVIEASHTRTDEYIYPLYQQPENLTKVQYVSRAHVSGGAFPVLETANVTREDIDGYNVLSNKNLELAWLRDDIDRYFLHIQGSGILRYPDGTALGVQYVGSNGYQYESVGKQMLKDGVLPPGAASMQGMKKHFRENPGHKARYLYHNKRYVFFTLTDSNPHGATGAEVVAGRSIATDPAVYPPGGLGFIMARKPVLDDGGAITGWEKFSRFVVNHDTGNAIRGPGRLDLYFGQGERAGIAAGHYMEHGRLFFLLKKCALTSSHCGS